MVEKILLLYLATLLHTSAYIAIAVVLALEIIKRFPIKKVVSGALLLGTILFFAGTKIISFMLAFMAALDPRYGMYLNASGERSNIVNFALRGFFWFCCIWNTGRTLLRREENIFISVLSAF